MKRSNVCAQLGHQWPIVGHTIDGKPIRGGTCARCGRPHKSRNHEAFVAMKRSQRGMDREIAAGISRAERARRKADAEASKLLARMISRDELEAKFGKPNRRRRLEMWIQRLASRTGYAVGLIKGWMTKLLGRQPKGLTYTGEFASPGLLTAADWNREVEDE